MPRPQLLLIRDTMDSLRLSIFLFEYSVGWAEDNNNLKRFGKPKYIGTVNENGLLDNKRV